MNFNEKRVISWASFKGKLLDYFIWFFLLKVKFSTVAINSLYHKIVCYNYDPIIKEMIEFNFNLQTKIYCKA